MTDRVMNGLTELAEWVAARYKEDPGSKMLGAVKRAEVEIEHLRDANQKPSPETHVKGSLWDQLVVLSGYHITRPPTPDYEFVQVCNGDLRKMVELMGQSVPYEKTAGRWRAFEDTTPGYWGIELENAGNDDDAIMCPIKIHRDTVARIVEAHNAALATEGKV